MSNTALPNDIETLHRLTEAQQGILYQCTLSEGLSAYQNQIRYSISGNFDPSLLKMCVEDVIARHEPLRSVYLYEGLEQPATVVKRTAELPFEQLDLSALSSEAQQAELTRISATNLGTKIPLDKAPLMRFMCIQLAPREFHLIIDFHHIIYDGWSNKIFLNEVQAFYAARLNQSNPELPPPTKFSDFIAAQSRPRDNDGLSFWKNKLTGVSTPTPLPLDKQRHGHGIANAQYQHHLSAAEASELRSCARAHRITVNTLIVSAWAYTLSRYTNSDDVMFGMAVNGRSRVMNDHHQTIGLFVNTLPLRLRCNSNVVLGEWLQYVQKELVQINEHDQTPLSVLHKMSDIKPGIELFETLIAFQDFPTMANAEDANRKIPWQYHDTIIHENSPLPFTLEVFDAESISFLVMYSDSRLDSGSTEQLVRHLCNTLRSFVSLTGVNKTVDDVNMLDAKEHEIESQHYLQNTIHSANAPILIDHVSAKSPSSDKSIIDLFASQLAIRPNALAVSDNTLSFTYKQLSKRVDVLEQYFMLKPIKAGDRVVICTARNVNMYPAMLALIKLSALFVPVDPAWPIKRIEQIVEDSKASLILADSSNVKALSGASIPVALIDGSSPVAALTGLVATDAIHQTYSILNNDNHIYLMYTSGSSGTPKGVIGTQSATLNRFNWMWQQYPFLDKDICVQKAALCFVDSIWELFGGLLAGVPTYIISDEQLHDVETLATTVQQCRATHLVIVPSLLSVLLDSVDNIGEKLGGLRQCTVSGEFLPVDLANLFKELLPNCTLLNLYGSTEVAADTCWTEISSALPYKSGQIGIPIPGCAAHILNNELKPMPPGAMGELCISGLGVTDGYIDTKSASNDAFVDNPFSDGFLYRTGDIASRGKDGTLTLHGRADSRHKLNGKRIDLLEISSVIMEHPQIKFATSLIDGNGQLISWYQSRTKEALDSASMNQFLADRLPGWMVPTKLLHLNVLPRLSSGKIDTDALLTIAEDQQSRISPTEAPLTDNEKALAKLWQEIIPGCSLTRDSVFVETGGDSLSAMRFNAAVQRTFKTNIPPRMMLVANLKQLARSMDSDAEKQDEQGVQNARSDSTCDPAVTEALAAPVSAEANSADLNSPEHKPLERKSLAPMSMQPIMFPAQVQSLYGVIHHPQQDTKEAAVLMCSSIGHEYMKLHSLYQSIATNLCKQGYCVMRFDYSGFGNSSGDPSTVNINHWREDILQASSTLLEASQKTKLTMIVSRLGLPLLATVIDHQITKIVALDPVYNGQAYTDHLKKLHQFALVNADRYRQAQTKSHPHERFGYLYSENLLNEIASLQVDLVDFEPNLDVRILHTGNPTDIDGSGRHCMDFSEFDGSASSSVTVESFPDLHIWSDYDSAQSLILHQFLVEHVAQMVDCGVNEFASKQI